MVQAIRAAYHPSVYIAHYPKPAHNWFSRKNTNPHDSTSEGIVLALSVDVLEPAHDTDRAKGTFVESLSKIHTA